MKYVFTIHGRPKNEKVDEVLAEVNKNFQEITHSGMRVMLSAKVLDATIETPEPLSKERQEILRKVIEEEYSKLLSDCYVEKAKEVYEAGLDG